MIKFLKFGLRKREVNVGVVNLLLIKFFRLIAFCFGFIVMSFIISDFLVFHDKNLLKSQELLVCFITTISAYLMAKLIEKFHLVYNLKKQFISSILELVVGNYVKVLILSFSVIWFLIMQYHNFTGYCYEERRYLTEQEIIKRVISGKSFIVKNNTTKNNSLLEKVKTDNECTSYIDKELNRSFPEKCLSDEFSYISAEEFYKKHPNCCSAGLSSENSIFSYFFGKATYWINVIQIDNPLNTKNYYKEIFYKSNSCGEIEDYVTRSLEKKNDLY